MFANPIWSLLLLATPIVVYVFIIRPRLDAKFTDLYSHLDSFWARLWARTYAFRSFFVASFGAVLVALPDLLVQVSYFDFSFLPHPWPMFVTIGTSISLALIRAYDTKPGEEK